jgi:hypothetical protein
VLLLEALKRGMPVYAGVGWFACRAVRICFCYRVSLFEKIVSEVRVEVYL